MKMYFISATVVYDRLSNILMKAPGGPQHCLVSHCLRCFCKKNKFLTSEIELRYLLIEMCCIKSCPLQVELSLEREQDAFSNEYLL